MREKGGTCSTVLTSELPHVLMVTKAQVPITSRIYSLPAPCWRSFDNANQSPGGHDEMGISFSSLVCGEPEPEEVTVEHGDSVPNSKAIHAAIASGLAAAAGVRNEELQAKRFDPRPSKSV